LGAASASLLAFTTMLITAMAAGRADHRMVILDSPGRGVLLRVDALSFPLLVMAAALWLAGLCVAPTSSFSPAAVRRSAMAAGCMLLAFATTSPFLLVGALVAGSGVFVLEHRATPRVARVAGLYLGLSALALATGAVMLELRWAESLGLWLAAFGLLVRKGIVPLHSWMPDSFEFGHLIPALLFQGPQVGAYAAVILLLPAASDGTLTLVAVLSLVTAVYGASLAVSEPDTRRAFGYLFMSQSALVLAGITTAERAAVAGSLAVWVASSLALSGMGLAITALELRRGRLSLRDYHGGYEQTPLLGLSFLLLGLASVGFPGTLGFLGEELLVGGTVARFPAFGFVVIVATALNGITVMRMYFSLFCGRRRTGIVLGLRPRELAVFAGLAAVLVASGLAPRYMVDSRLKAADAALATVAEGAR
ncbi:MAG: proton-conducting transporter membrane subunit, partial [Tepidiformaceae bacterium]